MATPGPVPNGRPDVTAPADRDLVLDRYTRHVNSSLASLARLIAAPVEVAAAGSKVRGSDGHTYLDCGGFGVFLLGHCHPVVVAAVREQLDVTRWPPGCSSTRSWLQAAEDLAGVTPAGLDYVFLTNSGAEAVELGLKLARLAGKRHVIAMHGGFHGKTLGALSVTGRAAVPRPVRPVAADGRLRPVRRPRRAPGRAHGPVGGAARARPGRGRRADAARRLPAAGPAGVHRGRRR